MLITGEPGLNGKLRVTVENVEDVTLYVYLMPNDFSKTKYDYHGIFVNNKITYGAKDAQSFEVPADWTVWLVYNPGFFDGEVRVKSRVVMYTNDDQNFISEMKPTGTSQWESQNQAIKLADFDTRENTIIANLQAQLAAEVDKAKQEQLQIDANRTLE